MSQTVRETVTVAAHPDVVWATVGDVGAVSTWAPALESSTLDGDVRTVQFAGGGGTAHERIVARDDERRAYTYQYLDGPLALERYESTISVTPTADGGSEVVWAATFAAGSPEEESGLRDAIAGIYSTALTELARQLS
jgi:hypothetical protein